MDELFTFVGSKKRGRTLTIVDRATRCDAAPHARNYYSDAFNTYRELCWWGEHAAMKAQAPALPRASRNDDLDTPVADSLLTRVKVDPTMDSHGHLLRGLTRKMSLPQLACSSRRCMLHHITT
jgi:hypothetical protein